MRGGIFMFLTAMPTWQTATIVVVLPTLIAITGPFVVRRFVRLERLRTNNEVAGFKFATVGVLYAVLLAFVVIVVWQKFNDADSVVSQEAGAVATIYRISADLPGGHGEHMHAALDGYLHAVVDTEFATMAEGRASHEVKIALDKLYKELLDVKATAPSDVVSLAELLRQLDQVTQLRRSRLVASQGVVPGVLWGTLIIGAFATLAFTLFFGTPNVRAQAMMTGILSVLLFCGLLIVVSFDHPFSGPVRVKPPAFHAVMSDFVGNERR
jgi:DMSO reductase anchor subunit